MPFREIILNNFWWKLAALVLAIGAYFAFKTRPGESRESRRSGSYITRDLVAHPITVSKSASDTREFKVTPSEVDITLTGDSELLRLDGREIRATVDLTGVSGPTNFLPIQLRVPDSRGIELVRMVPDTVQVELLKQ